MADFWVEKLTRYLYVQSPFYLLHKSEKPKRTAQTQKFEMMGILAALAVVQVTIWVFEAIEKGETALNFEETDLERRSL